MKTERILLRGTRGVGCCFLDDPDDDKAEIKIVLPLQLGTFHASKGLQAETVFVFLNTRWFWNDIND
jgi:ATP-dependent exoDNAse (exonuclease V) beta subunit